MSYNGIQYLYTTITFCKEIGSFCTRSWWFFLRIRQTSQVDKCFMYRNVPRIAFPLAKSSVQNTIHSRPFLCVVFLNFRKSLTGISTTLPMGNATRRDKNLRTYSIWYHTRRRSTGIIHMMCAASEEKRLWREIGFTQCIWNKLILASLHTQQTRYV